MKHGTIGVGLVGFGFGGAIFHGPIIAAVKGLELRAIVERSTDRARHEYPSARICRSYSELLSDPDVHLVVVSTDNTSHFEIASAALRANKHVVVDKPITVTSAEAQELTTLAASRGLTLSPFHNRRWDGDFRTVQRVLIEGSLGQISRFESYFDRFRPELRPYAWRERPQSGSGLLYDLGPHLLDQAFHLFGSPLGLSADVRIERGGALVDDAFDLTLFYPGTEVRLGASMLKPEPRPRFRIQGNRGGFIKHGFDPQEDALKRGERPKDSRWGVEDVDRRGELETENGSSAIEVSTVNGDYRLYYANVRDAISGYSPLQVTPEDGIAVIRAIELAIESNRLQQRIEWQMQPR